VAEGAVPRTVLADYFNDTPRQRVTALVDYVGVPDGQGIVYRMGDRMVRANNDVVSSITGFPSQMAENWRVLFNPGQRRLLARAMVDNSLLTAQRRKTLFSILLWGTLLVYAMVGIAIGFTNREALGAYQSGWSLFFYSLATSMFLPTPFEILLLNAAETIGVALTVFIAAMGKVVGSWLVLLMGDKAHEGLANLTEKNVAIRKIMNAMEAFARKFGYVAIFIIFAIPFMTDTAPLFVLAVLNMRKAPFLLVMFAAIVARSLIFLYLF
jgi:hypothetical protein